MVYSSARPIFRSFSVAPFQVPEPDPAASAGATADRPPRRAEPAGAAQESTGFLFAGAGPAPANGGSALHGACHCTSRLVPGGRPGRIVGSPVGSRAADGNGEPTPGPGEGAEAGKIHPVTVAPNFRCLFRKISRALG